MEKKEEKIHKITRTDGHQTGKGKFYLGSSEPVLSANSLISRAARIHIANYAAILSFWSAYQTIKPVEYTFNLDSANPDINSRTPRGRRPEAVTDLLRAQVVFAAAGLDAVIKQLIRDCLPALIEINSTSRKALSDYAAKIIVDQNDKMNVRVLADALTAQGANSYFISKLVERLERTSFQSKDQLLKNVRYLGISESELKSVLLARKISFDDLESAFECRHQIIHEMDTSDQGSNWTRRIRSEKLLISHTTKLFQTTQEILRMTDEATQLAN